MKKIFIEIIRRNFLNLNNTKKECQQYMKTALETNGLKDIKKEELSGQLDTLSNEFDEILNLIKEQELSMERKSTYLLFPKFFVRNLVVNKKMNFMKNKFNDFVQEKSNLSFEEYKKSSNK